MKKVRLVTLVATALAVLMASSVAFAQPHRHRRGGFGGELRALAPQLGLDARQQQALEAIVAEARSAREAARALPRGSQEAREARRALRDQMRARIAAVLTPAQRARLVQLRQERHRGCHHRRGRIDA